MRWSEGIVYPNLEEVRWLLGLVAAVHALRVGAWTLGDADLRLLVLEALACAEMMSLGPALGPGRATAAGGKGPLLDLEGDGQPGVLSGVGAVSSAVGGVLLGDLLGAVHRRLDRIQIHHVGFSSPHREIQMQPANEGSSAWSIERTYHLKYTVETRPAQLPMLHSAAVEATGTFVIEVVFRALTPTHQCIHALHHWASFLAKYAVYVCIKLLAVNLTGSIFNPMTAAVSLHMCFLEEKYVSQLVFVYLICPCLGAILAAKVTPIVKNFSHTFHECFGIVMDSGHDRDL